MFQKVQMAMAGAIPLDANVEFVLRDAQGNVKPIFQENRLCTALLKRGYLSPLWINWRIAPLIAPLLGYWATAKDGRNLITNAGKAAAASRLNGAGGAAAFTAIGIGTGTTAANAADTALESGKAADGTADSGVHALATASVTASRVTTTVTNDTAQLVGTVTFTGTVAVTESGVFNADTNGTMIARQVFSAINVVATDTLQLTWKIKAA
jgi:hypothetical protein